MKILAIALLLSAFGLIVWDHEKYGHIRFKTGIAFMLIELAVVFILSLTLNS
jgi:hypothetical protein